MDFPRKPALAEADILPEIKERWSPMAFSSQPIEEEKITAMFEAARWAPSSYNEQPWFYVYALKGDEGREQIEHLLAEGNSWAKEAWMLIIQFAKPLFDHNGKENRHAIYDSGCASGYLVLQLKELGLIGHQMAGFRWKEAGEVLGAPDGYTATAMMAVGYPGDPGALPADLRERQDAPRVRKPKSSFVFRNAFPS